MNKIYESMTAAELREELRELVRAYPCMTKADRRIAWRRIQMLRRILKIS